MIIFVVRPLRADKIRKFFTVSGIVRKIIVLLFSSFILWGAEAFAQYDTNVFFFRGRQAIIDGKYADAIENFNILVTLDPTNYLTYF